MEHITEIVDIYKDFVYAVMLYEDGHRCGYVKIHNKPLFDKLRNEYEEHIYCPSVDCHGGITFVEHLVDNSHLPKGDWIGFDCNHCGDGHDYETVKKVFGDTPARYWRFAVPSFGDGVIRTKQYVADECKAIIDQLTKMEG